MGVVKPLDTPLIEVIDAILTGRRSLLESRSVTSMRSAHLAESAVTFRCANRCCQSLYFRSHV